MNTKKGFTLVELLLAIAFLSVLLLSITLLIVHVIAVYQKGMSIRAVSNTGKTLIDDVSRSIIASPIQDIAVEDKNGDGKIEESEEIASLGKYYFQEYRNIILPEDETTDRPDEAGTVPMFGAFCTGTHTYLWQTGYIFNSDQTHVTYQYFIDGTSHTTDDFRLLKIYDPAREICQQHINNPGSRYFSAVSSQRPPVELLDSSESNLAIYDFRVFPAVQNHITGHAFYSSSFILATLKGGVNITASGNYCKEPTYTLATDFAYCSINKFNFAVRSTGEVDWDVDYGQR